MIFRTHLNAFKLQRSSVFNRMIDLFGVKKHGLTRPILNELPSKKFYFDLFVTCILHTPVAENLSLVLITKLRDLCIMS